MAALRKLVDLPLAASSVRWEIVNWPEEDGGFVPVNIGATILVAELAPLDTDAFVALPSVRAPHVVVEAARPWLDDRFRALYRRIPPAPVDFASHSNCRAITATLQTTKMPVEGVVCTFGDKAMVRLVLGAYT